MQIIIQTLSDRKITLEVKVSDCIKNIKEKIQEKELIPIEAQRIIFHGKELKDWKTVFDYNVIKESTLLLFLHLSYKVIGMKIFIRTLRKRLLVLEFGDIEKHKEIKANLEKIVDNPPVHQKYFSLSKEVLGRTPGISFESDLCNNIMAIILDKEEIPVNNRIILAGEILKDGTTLCSYNNIPKNSLRLFQRLADGLLIYIKTIRGRLIEVKLGALDTNEQVKAKIQEKVGIPPDHQHFSFVRRKVKQGKIIEKWREDGKTISLEVEASDTIKNIKAIIQTKEKIPCNEQFLFFNTKELKNGNLSYYKIQNESTIIVLCPQSGIKIFVRTLDTHKSIITGEIVWMAYGKTIPMKIEAFDSIKYIKTIIEVIEGVRPDHQRLFFKGKKLEDEKVISDYNIENESTLDVHFSLNFSKV